MVGFLPGTYGTSLLRSHATRGVFEVMAGEGMPSDAVKGLADSIDCTVYLFDSAVPQWVMYTVLCGCIGALVVAYILMNKFKKKV